MERPNEIRLSQAALMLGVNRPELKRLILAGTITAVGSGPARRILVDSIEKSGLPIQAALPFPEPKKQWFILTKSGDCRARDGEGYCTHRSLRFGCLAPCAVEICPLAVKTPCKSKS